VQFASTSNRYALIDRMLGGFSILFGDTRESPGPRALMSERHIAEILADRKVTPEEAADVMFSNRNYAAETTLDAILKACGVAEASSRVEHACRILRDWNRRNDRDSRGALLFTTAWRGLSAIPNFHAQSFDPEHPYRVRGVSTEPEVANAIRAVLDAAMAELNGKGLKGDEPWGQMLGRETAQGRVPLHGGSAEEGVLNVLSGGPLRSGGYADVRYGSSYAHVVTWKDGKLDARVLLAHGQSIDPAAPHFADQLALFADKRLEALPFTDAQIEADTAVVMKKVRAHVP
jgi:acyl-homoserine-lactone acylase